ncbi:MAG: hypothetical protein ACTSV7_08940, partial [Candidatus Baldrarchaeia archaeon]
FRGYELLHSDLVRIIDLLAELKNIMIEVANSVKLQAKPPVSEEAFKESLDRAIARSTTSTGWALLSEVEALVSSELKLESDRFEELFRSFIEKYGDYYELAPGGTKQFTVRGEYYGLIRKR